MNSSLVDLDFHAFAYSLGASFFSLIDVGVVVGRFSHNCYTWRFFSSSFAYWNSHFYPHSNKTPIQSPLLFLFHYFYLSSTSSFHSLTVERFNKIKIWKKRAYFIFSCVFWQWAIVGNSHITRARSNMWFVHKSSMLLTTTAVRGSKWIELKCGFSFYFIFFPEFQRW